MSESSSNNASLEVVAIAEGVLRAWHQIRVYHGRLPAGPRDSVRRMCHRVVLCAVERGHEVHYQFTEERIDVAIGPPDAEAVTSDVLQSIKPYVTEDWKIFS